MFPRETHILVVDDSLNIRRMVTETLQKMGFAKITTCGDANEAMEKLTKANETNHPVTLILSDLNMPGPSGLDFLQNLKTMDAYKGIPFILVTTESEKGAVLRAATLGVSSYVVKPFNVETLGKKMLEAWKKHNK